ncbi:MAG TPA: hypothetical protein VF658_01150 [Pyrinomonadaceae bacterium]|jgi:hypothetical protein
MSTEERLVRLENAFVTLTRIVESIDSRLNTQPGWINSLGEAQANTEVKIVALADAQIRAEEAHARLEAAQVRTEEALARLAEAQAHTDRRLDALIDIVRESRNGRSET